jgi:hypothetical protein
MGKRSSYRISANRKLCLYLIKNFFVPFFSRSEVLFFSWSNLSFFLFRSSDSIWRLLINWKRGFYILIKFAKKTFDLMIRWSIIRSFDPRSFRSVAACKNLERKKTLEIMKKPKQNKTEAHIHWIVFARQYLQGCCCFLLFDQLQYGEPYINISLKMGFMYM